MSQIVNVTLESLPMLFIEDVFLTGFMAQKAGLSKIVLDQQMAQFNCDLVKTGHSTDFSPKGIIGDKCSPSDLIKIHSTKLQLTNLNSTTSFNQENVH